MAQPAPRMDGPPPPAPSIADTPEFKAAIKSAMDSMRSELMESLKAAAPTGGEDANSLFRQMAMTLSEISDQGNHRKKVDPKVMEARRIATEEMCHILNDIARNRREARASNDPVKIAEADAALLPRYTVTSKQYIGDQIVEPFRQDPGTKVAIPQEIGYLGEPNDGMRPINPIAKQIFALFRASRGGAATGRTQRDDNRGYLLSPKGLVIKGSHQRQQVTGSQTFNEDLTDDMLVIDRAHNPNAEYVAVLGTIAQPARQNYQGQPI